MTISVTILKDEQGQFSISVDQDAKPDQDMTANPSAAAPADTDQAQDNPPTPVKSLEQALSLAAKVLSQPTEGSQSMFDEGMKSSMPTPAGQPAPQSPM